MTLAVIGVALIIAGIYLYVLYREMKTIVPQKEANVYVVDGSFNLKKEKDSFLYTSMTRTKIEKNEDND